MFWVLQPRLPHSFVQLASRLVVMVKLVLGHGNVADYKVEPTLHFVVAIRALLSFKRDLACTHRCYFKISENHHLSYTIFWPFITRLWLNTITFFFSHLLQL